MRSLSYILAFLASVSMLFAGAAWWSAVRDPNDDSTAGHAALDSRAIKWAGRATAIAFILSGLAALAGVIGWFLR